MYDNQQVFFLSNFSKMKKMKVKKKISITIFLFFFEKINKIQDFFFGKFFFATFGLFKRNI
jgi:hypothetical protein